MKKGSLLLTALLTASFLVACENKGSGKQAQSPTEQKTTQEETAPAEQPQQEETKNEETANGEEQATEGEQASEEGNQTTGAEENKTTGEEEKQKSGEQNGEAQGGNNEQTQTKENATENVGGDVKKGEQLFTANGCTACHQAKADGVGPSLAKISQAYAGKKEDLIKFLKGEGKAIVDPAKFSIMQPNLAKTKGLADGDLSALADYILSIK